MKKQFKISMRPKIESGEYKVVTRDGRQVRILCYDKKGAFPVIALIDDGETEHMEEYKKDGCLVLPYNSKSSLDLFVVTPEQEATKLEEAVFRCIADYNPETLSDEEMMEIALEESKKITELVQQELLSRYDATKVDEELIEQMCCDKEKKFQNLYGMSVYREGLYDMYKQFAKELYIAFKNQDEVIYNKGYDKGVKEANAKWRKWYEEMTEETYGKDNN